MSEKRPAVSVQDGDKIRELRKARLGVSASQLARTIGIKPQSMINIEKGTRGASLSLLVRIARKLGEPLDSLLREPAADDEEETKAAA